MSAPIERLVRARRTYAFARGGRRRLPISQRHSDDLHSEESA